MLRVVVLASGYLLLYGLFYPYRAVRCGVWCDRSALSSVSLAAARMGWPVGSYDVVRIRTREADEIRRVLLLPSVVW